MKGRRYEPNRSHNRLTVFELQVYDTCKDPADTPDSVFGGDTGDTVCAVCVCDSEYV